MPRYSRTEQIDMLLIYGECLKNSYAAERLYLERYPGRQQPSRRYFQWLEEKLRTEPNVHEDQEAFVINEETEINVLALVQYDSTISSRQIGAELAISKDSARKILKKHRFKSFKYQLHQHLYENDGERRLEYCNWFLRQNAENHLFNYYILFTDESRFTNNGLFNRNNTR